MKIYNRASKFIFFNTQKNFHTRFSEVGVGWLGTAVIEKRFFRKLCEKLSIIYLQFSTHLNLINLLSLRMDRQQVTVEGEQNTRITKTNCLQTVIIFINL